MASVNSTTSQLGVTEIWASARVTVANVTNGSNSAEITKWHRALPGAVMISRLTLRSPPSRTYILAHLRWLDKLQPTAEAKFGRV